ncbi:DUF3572 domain-containing protein [Candidatus Halocynthiibacter alkanivorans]|jgi:Protein of unknown function (DUF3572)|uniref:DUF3572 domain-containing protein n=1 Tax=Candidatus Halocynthiibacter alkanivorans TaxID=2267619 RepID=UPI000DF1B79C|nr:DUF3572 domain-containing protein [Candidatus Halocynthiibacter alkanivorans]
MKQNSAETVAIQALSWLVSHEELMPVFLGASGVSSDDLRAGASDPAFLASVLDFLTMNDQWVMEFCDSTGLAYDAPMSARQQLPGGAQIHWT